jgi:hypothetical protein
MVSLRSGEPTGFEKEMSSPLGELDRVDRVLEEQCGLAARDRHGPGVPPVLAGRGPGKVEEDALAVGAEARPEEPPSVAQVAGIDDRCAGVGGEIMDDQLPELAIGSVSLLRDEFRPVGRPTGAGRWGSRSV